MGWPSRINKILQVIGTGTAVANDLGLPVPNVLKAVEAIHGNPAQNDNDADALNAAAIDALAVRLKGLETEVKSLRKQLEAKGGAK